MLFHWVEIFVQLSCRFLYWSYSSAFHSTSRGITSSWHKLIACRLLILICFPNVYKGKSFSVCWHSEISHSWILDMSIILLLKCYAWSAGEIGKVWGWRERVIDYPMQAISLTALVGCFYLLERSASSLENPETQAPATVRPSCSVPHLSDMSARLFTHTHSAAPPAQQTKPVEYTDCWSQVRSTWTLRWHWTL